MNYIELELFVAQISFWEIAFNIFAGMVLLALLSGVSLIALGYHFELWKYDNSPEVKIDQEHGNDGKEVTHVRVHSLEPGHIPKPLIHRSMPDRF